MEMSSEPSLKDYMGTLSIIIAIISLILELAVAYRTRMRLDWSMIIISLAFLLSFAIRTIVSTLS